MSLLDLPIPDPPATFNAHNAPPGIAVDFGAFLDPDGDPWYLTRPNITPRVCVVHTNAASREGSLISQINWGNLRPYGNTHPHYAINQPQPTKLVPSDRRGIGNSTASHVEIAYNERDVSFWSIVIETADMGSIAANAQGINWPTDCGPFLHNHAELVARILAYESIVHGFPLAYPDVWNGSGVAAHTDPFPYPFYTTVPGKTCPGTTKKNDLRNELLPRARQIRDAWTDPPEEAAVILVKPADARFKGGLFTADGHPVSPEVRDMVLAGGGEIVEQDHPHWDAATWHRMGAAARELYRGAP